MAFAATPPPVGKYLAPSNHIGALAIVAPCRVEYGVAKFGELKDVIYAGVWIILGEGAGSEFPDAEITGSKLYSQFLPLLGQYTCGRFAYGKAGSGKPPVILEPASAEDIAVCETWMERNPGKVEKVLANAGKAPATSAPSGSDLPPVTPPF